MTDLVKRLRDMWRHSEEDCYAAADRIEKLEEALRETLSFVETYSYRWDGFNETPPAILLDKARKALEGKDD